MLRFLFPRLTRPQADRGSALFAAVTAKAREPHWYREGSVADTIDGRFRVLSTLAALVMVRLEQLGDEGDLLSVALTERFIDAMEAEHRELGLGDPTLGRTVRKLVGSLARRVELWRSATAGEINWAAATTQSVDADDGRAPPHTGEALRRFWFRLGEADLEALAEGRFG